MGRIKGRLAQEYFPPGEMEGLARSAVGRDVTVGFDKGNVVGRITQAWVNGDGDVEFVAEIA